MFVRKFQKKKISHDDIAVLKYLQGCGYQSAIIAGGAVRDSYFKKNIADIDIYVQDNRTSQELVCLDFHMQKDVHEVLAQKLEKPEFFNPLFFKKKRKQNDDDWNLLGTDEDVTYAYVMRHINFIYDMKIFGQRYQIMGVDMKPLDYVMKKFNINISKCYCDGIKMTYPHGFLEDARNHTITVDGELSKEEYKKSMLRYVPKIKRKYPDFTIVDTLRNKFIKK